MRITQQLAKRTISQPRYEVERERALKPKELTPGQNYLARLITHPHRPRIYSSDFLVVVNELTQDPEIPIISRFLAPYSRLSMAAILSARQVDDKSDIRPVDEEGIVYNNRFLLSCLPNLEIGYLPRPTAESEALMRDAYGNGETRPPACM